MRRGHSGIAARAVGALCFALATGLAHPAAAGDLAELECAVAGLSETTGSALVAGVERGARFSPGNPAIPVAAEVILACRQRFDWNREEHRAASHYVPAFLAKQRMRAMLEGQGLDLDALERRVLADSALIGAAAEMRRNPPELMAFLRRLDPPVLAWVQLHSSNRELTNVLGGFIAATAIVEGMRVRFARS